MITTMRHSQSKHASCEHVARPCSTAILFLVMSDALHCNHIISLQAHLASTRTSVEMNTRKPTHSCATVRYTLDFQVGMNRPGEFIVMIDQEIVNEF